MFILKSFSISIVSSLLLLDKTCELYTHYLRGMGEYPEVPIKPLDLNILYIGLVWLIILE
jgi:hypothetical protein